VTPREKAASSGVLAMSDALAELQDRKLKTGTTSAQGNVAAEVQATASQPSLLTINVTRGSQGIAGGVAHQSVLGASGLPDREDSRQGIGSSTGSASARGRSSTPPSGAVRSAEEIQEVLDRHKGAMYTLYNRELRKDATLQGKLVMSITIAPTGNVSHCVILSSELGADSLEQQLVALIKGIDFGNKPGVPAVTTKIPIEFFPR
jgi:TonB family protein